MNPRRPVTRRVLPGSPFNVPEEPAAPVPTFSTDTRVSHDRHGLGVVAAVDGDDIVVDFGGGTRHRIAKNSPKLTKL
jgi:hypothetical protein